MIVNRYFFLFYDLIEEFKNHRFAVMQSIEKLVEIMQSLRDPDNGCPWDLEQDFQSLIPYTIEEAYEVADAI